jgi:hypothetical protein
VEPRFVGEDIEPVPCTADVTLLARGQPGVPRRFVWRGTEYAVVRLLDESRRVGPCTSGSDEQYVRKHIYIVETACGLTMKLSCDRHARRGAARWRLISIEKQEGEDGHGD